MYITPKVIIELINEDVENIEYVLGVMVEAVRKCIDRKTLRQIIDVLRAISRCLEESFTNIINYAVVDTIRKFIEVRKILEKKILNLW